MPAGKRSAPGAGRNLFVGKATQIAAVYAFGVVATVVTTMAVHAAEDAPASSFVTLKLEGACDAQNTRLWLVNAHTFKTVATTVRWRAAGGKDLSEEFFPAPNSIR